MTTNSLKQITKKFRSSDFAVIILSLILFVVIGFSECSLFCVSTKEKSRNYAINMTPGEIVTQYIPENLNHLKSISLSIGTYGRTNDGTIIIKLYEDDTLIEQWERKTNNLYDSAYSIFTLSHQLNKTPEHEYYFTVEDVYEGDNSVALWATEIGENTELTCIYATISRRQKACFMTFFLIILAEAISICFLIREPSVRNNKSTSIVSYLSTIICTILLAISLYYFLTEALEKYSIISSTPTIYLIMTATLAISAICLYTSNKKEIKTPFVIYFAVLFIIYILRAPGDAFSGYLWAEDGFDLLQGAIYEGPSSLMKVTSGTHWFVPRLVGLISYWICVIFDDLSIYPPLQGLICKTIAVGSITYFMSKRFEWLIKEKAIRFIVCAVVIFSIPYFDSDVTTCDTSVPFVMVFAAFLIGLDTLCSNKARNASILETVFLSLTAISNAEAPICAGVSILAFTRWLVSAKKENKLNTKHIISESVKPSVVCLFSLIQFIGILQSDRSAVKIDLGKRLFICIKHFIFVPYFSTYKNWSLFFIALAGFIAIAYLARISWKVVAYSSCFSYLHIAYSSLSAEPNDISNHLFTEPFVGGRYILTSVLIAGFILSVEIYFLWKSKFTLTRFIGLALFIVIITISTLTYTQTTYGMEYSDTYTDNVDVFDRSGSQYLLIHIGPWDPYMIRIPWNISEYTLRTDPVDNNHIDSVTSTADNSMMTVTGWAAAPNGDPFAKVFIKIDGSTYLSPIETFPRPDIIGNNNQLSNNYGYCFRYYPHYIDNNTLDFIGITHDGYLYSWTSIINTSSENYG